MSEKETGTIAANHPTHVAALRICLAPLRLDGVFDAALAYVLEGVGGVSAGSWAGLPTASLVIRPFWMSAQGFDVAAVHPGWTVDDAVAARRDLYREAPAGTLARFGHLLDALSTRESWDTTSRSWLDLLVEDVYSQTKVHGKDVRDRWSADLIAEVAQAGGVPDGTPARAALSSLLRGHHNPSWVGRVVLLADDAGDAFLAQNATVLRDLVHEADPGVRRYVTLRCAGRPEAHADLFAMLAVDEDRAVRAAALVGLAGLDPALQVDLLRPCLLAAAPDRLAEVLGRLAELDGGGDVLEETLAAARQQPLDDARAEALRRAAARARLARLCDTVVQGLPDPAPADGELLADLRAKATEARRLGYPLWPDIRHQLAKVRDVRALRNVLRDTGHVDADRRVAELLITRKTSEYGAKIGAVLTPEDAMRWWPLFAERLDLADEYLDDVDTVQDWSDKHFDTADMMLTILGCFPAPPEPLVERLTSIALGDTRHRFRARQVLGDHAGARTAARAALHGTRPTARASAAEWLASLGEDGVTAPRPGWEFGDGVLSPAAQSLPAHALGLLDRFRQKALDRGVPRPDVDRWLGLARPALRAVPEESRVTVGRLGGPLMLPPGVPSPGFTDRGDGSRHDEQLILTLDLAAVPAAATDLPLPADGSLLLFVNPTLDPWPAGGAIHVPAGTPLEERAQTLTEDIYEYQTPERLDAALREQGEVRLGPGVSLPATPPDSQILADHPHADTLRKVWSDLTGPDAWQIGGHPANFDDYGDPVNELTDPESGNTLEDPGDWELLAQWAGFPSAIVYWIIRRQDLAAGRFDRVAARMQSNP